MGRYVQSSNAADSHSSAVVADARIGLASLRCRSEHMRAVCSRTARAALKTSSFPLSSVRAPVALRLVALSRSCDLICVFVRLSTAWTVIWPSKDSDGQVERPSCFSRHSSYDVSCSDSNPASSSRSRSPASSPSPSRSPASSQRHRLLSWRSYSLRKRSNGRRAACASSRAADVPDQSLSAQRHASSLSRAVRGQGPTAR